MKNSEYCVRFGVYWLSTEYSYEVNVHISYFSLTSYIILHVLVPCDPLSGKSQIQGQWNVQDVYVLAYILIGVYIIDPYHMQVVLIYNARRPTGIMSLYYWKQCTETNILCNTGLTLYNF